MQLTETVKTSLPRWVQLWAARQAWPHPPKGGWILSGRAKRIPRVPAFQPSQSHLRTSSEMQCGAGCRASSFTPPLPPRHLPPGALSFLRCWVRLRGSLAGKCLEHPPPLTSSLPALCRPSHLLPGNTLPLESGPCLEPR